MESDYETAKRLVESGKVWRFEPEEWAEEQWEPFEALPVFYGSQLDVLVTNPLNSCHPLGGRVIFEICENDLYNTKITLAGVEAQRYHIEYGKGPYHGYWTKDDERNMLVEAAEEGDPSLYGDMNEEEKAEYERLRKVIREFNEEFEREILSMKMLGVFGLVSGEEEERETDGGEKNGECE